MMSCFVRFGSKITTGRMRIKLPLPLSSSSVPPASIAGTPALRRSSARRVVLPEQGSRLVGVGVVPGERPPRLVLQIKSHVQERIKERQHETAVVAPGPRRVPMCTPSAPSDLSDGSGRAELVRHAEGVAYKVAPYRSGKPLIDREIHQCLRRSVAASGGGEAGRNRACIAPPGDRPRSESCAVEARSRLLP